MEYALNKSIRCDKCHVAEAKQVFEMKAGPLYFCQHHSNKYESAILGQGGVLIPQLDEDAEQTEVIRDAESSTDKDLDEGGDENKDLVGSNA